MSAQLEGMSRTRIYGTGLLYVLLHPARWDLLPALLLHPRREIDCIIEGIRLTDALEERLGRPPTDEEVRRWRITEEALSRAEAALR
jgi:hypothetical protein